MTGASSLASYASVAALLAGTLFFGAGTAGFLRFPDVFSRLHALTKADNLGIGFIALGIALQQGTWGAAGKLLLLWVMMVVASALSASIIAAAASGEEEPGEEEPGEESEP